MQIQIYHNFKSPNFDNRQKNSKINFLVLHYTETNSLREAINILCSPKKKVSSHYLIDINGDIYNLVEEKKRAWHAGISFWRNYENLNNSSVGIEIVNSGEMLKKKYPDKQIESLINLSKQIKLNHNINTSNILGHSDIAPRRKIDPGIFFPWNKLALHELGFWIEISEDDSVINLKLTEKEIKKFLKNLNKIGYKEIISDYNFESNLHIINAFHRHYIPKLIEKFPTKLSYIISKKILKLIQTS
tara:strand:- start:296 stop:1030 length:735 start_codon:yes stop_codon:yes gene_type:complete